MCKYNMLLLDQQRRIIITILQFILRYCIYTFLNLYLRFIVLTKKCVQIAISHSVYIEILYLQFIESISKIYCISYNFQEEAYEQHWSCPVYHPETGSK